MSLTNSGFLAIYPNTVTCWVLNYIVRRQNVYPDIGGIHNIAFKYTAATTTPTDGTEGELSRGETADFIPVPPIRFEGLIAESAEFLIITDYHQRWWPFALHKRIKYFIFKDMEGKWEWIRPYMSKADRTLDPSTIIIFDKEARKKALEKEAKEKSGR